MLTIALDVARATNNTLEHVLWQMPGVLFFAIAKELGYTKQEDPDDILNWMVETGKKDEIQAFRKSNPPPPRPIR